MDAESSMSMVEHPQSRAEGLVSRYLASLCLILSVATAGMRFGVDWAAFRAPGDSSRVEVFYAIPFDQLEYSASDTGLVGRFSIRFEMTGDKGVREEGVIFKQARIASFSEARESRRTFVDGFSVTVPPGEYQLRMAVARPAAVQADTTGERVDYVEAGTWEDSISVPRFGPGLSLSTIQLAAGVAYDTVSGGFSVIPNPMRRYGGTGRTRVYFYYEGYGLEPAADSYDLKVSVLRLRADSPAQETVIVAEPMRKHKSGTRVSSAFGVDVAGLAPGEYALDLELSDVGRHESRSRQAVFRVGDETETPGHASPYRMTMTELEKKYYRELDYIATRREIGYYNTLSDSGKEAYLGWYWARHNLGEFARRMETAGAKYKTARTSGLATDRGRVYVKYGKPDEVEARVIEVDRKPREYWRYYGMGYVFVFIDIGNDGNFRLAYTTSPDEPKTGYEHYLTQDEEELFRQ